MSSSRRLRRGRHPGGGRPPHGGWFRWRLGVASLVLVLIAAVLVVAVVLHQRAAPGTEVAQLPSVGTLAPDGGFTTIQGNDATVSSLQGKPTLLWFVTTWCSTCQAGTTFMTQHIEQLQQAGVRVVELQLYKNLGGQGPSIEQWHQVYGKGQSGWIWGTASQQLSYTYDPQGYLDVYYLLDSSGHIRELSSAPQDTWSQLMAAVQRIGTS